MKKPIVDSEGFMHFERMSQAQKNAMNHVAFNGYATDVIPTQKVLLTLQEIGLIEPSLNDFWMPFHIHMAWCSYVATKNTGEES
jgi:hypothetical protein